jgi:phage terminase large subunit-like protein
MTKNQISRKQINRWKRDPIAFIRGVLIDPETGRPFELYPAQEQFLREAFTAEPDGRLRYPELVYSAPKKSGKTATAAMTAIYVIVCLGGPYAEAYCVANDLEQAQGRVFQAIARMIAASPLLKASTKITANKIEFSSTGATISAIASDYAGAAGANPTLIVFDELWGYTSERSRRLWDEMVPVPTRKISLRLTVTYAGFEGESELLESLYKRGLRGEEIAPSLYRSPGLLTFWSHDPVAPWQTPAWQEQMLQQLRRNAYLRLIENRWVTSESQFVEMAWWEACTDSALRPVMEDRALPVWVGVDASVKRDSTAIVACAWDGKAKRARLVWHRTFQPSPDDPLDFEMTIEKSLLELHNRFDVREVRYDPYQLVAVAQRLQKSGLRMVEVSQTVPNLTEASTNLYELIKGRNLVVYPDADMRLAISRAVALETSRGFKIAKEKTSHKIDVIVALAQAALGAVLRGQMERNFALEYCGVGVAKVLMQNGFTGEAASKIVGVPLELIVPGKILDHCSSPPSVDLYKIYQENVARLSGQRNCARCGKDLAPGSTFISTADERRFCSAECAW